VIEALAEDIREAKISGYSYRRANSNCALVARRKQIVGINDLDIAVTESEVT
jgi:hypothetical protein